jgi:transposase-like protein
MEATKKTKTVPAEVRERAVRMVRSTGRPRVAVGGDAVDRGEDRLHGETLRSWVRQAERDGASAPG